MFPTIARPMAQGVPLALAVSAFQTTPPPAQGTSPGNDSAVYMVRIGPIPDRDRAAALAKQLVAGGFAEAKVITQAEFRVVSEPLPRSVAADLTATLAGRGIRSQVEALAGDTAQLLFGTFAAREEAETLSQRIGAQGYDAWVRERLVYALQLGPYPQSSVNTIAAIVKLGAPDAGLAADPVASQTASPPIVAPTPPVAPPTPPAAAPQAPPSPAAAPPASPPAVAPSQVSPPPPSNATALSVVRVGPIPDRDRAAAIAKQLAAGGFAEAKVTTQPGFRVVSEPLPRTIALDLVATLAGRGIRSQLDLAEDTVQILFGIFTVQAEAEALSRRIGALGYDAWVREGPVYLLQLGPYPQSSVNTIAGIVKSGAPEAGVTAAPVSSQSTSPSASTPVAAPQGTPPPTPAPQVSSPVAAPSQISPPPSNTPPSTQSPTAPPSPSQAPATAATISPPPSPALASPPGGTSFLIVPGQSVGPMRLGTPLQEGLAQLGPARTTMKLDEGITEYRWFALPGNTGIGVTADQRGTVLAVRVLNDARYSTKEGLHVGSTEAQIRAALGVPSKIEITVQPMARRLIYDALGLWFGIQLDRRSPLFNAVFDIGVMAKK